MTLGIYLSNAKSLGYSPSKAFERLIKEFERGHTSYPRSDGKNHAGLKIINDKKIDRVVKQILKHRQEGFEYDKNEIRNGDVYIISEHLGITTPSSSISDIKKAKKLKKKDIEEVKEEDIFQFLIPETDEELMVDISKIDFENSLKRAFHKQKIKYKENQLSF